MEFGKSRGRINFRFTPDVTLNTGSQTWWSYTQVLSHTEYRPVHVDPHFVFFSTNIHFTRIRSTLSAPCVFRQEQSFSVWQLLVFPSQSHLFPRVMAPTAPDTTYLVWLGSSTSRGKSGHQFHLIHRISPFCEFWLLRKQVRLFSRLPRSRSYYHHFFD